jgi:hypothetical protein
VSDNTWQLRSSPVAPARETTVAELETMAEGGKLLPVHQVFHQAKTKGKWVAVTSFPKLASLMEIADVAINGLPEDQPANASAWQTAEVPFSPAPIKPMQPEFKPRRYIGVIVVYVLLLLCMLFTILAAFFQCLVFMQAKMLLGVLGTVLGATVALTIFGLMLTAINMMVDIASDIKRTADRS